jgi:MOSC domain-containing protein YiiM
VNVVSVNVRGDAEIVYLGSRRVETGIRKQPVERARVHELGLEGDVVADQVNHGGPDQAVYLYASGDLEWWSRQLGEELAPGAFGENLTLSSFGERPVRIGDRFRVGDVTLEATAPRIPCAVFATHLAEHDWVKRFVAARRPGFYARVLEAGEIARGDGVDALGGGEEHPEVVALLDAWYDPSPPAELLEALLAAPLAVRARAACEEKLARLAVR